MTEPSLPAVQMRRPPQVGLLVFTVLLVAAWGGLRLGEAAAFWPTLREYGAHPGPLYLAISGGFWLLAGLLLAAGLWFRKGWAWYASVVAAAGYASWRWFDRLVCQQPRANWPFALGVTLAVLLIVFALLFSRETISFFQIQRKSHAPK